MSNYEAYKELQKKVRKAHRRFCVHLYYASFVKALFYMTLLTAIVVSVLAFVPQEINRLLVAGGIVSLTIPLSIYLYFRKRGNIEQTALMADKHLHLKEKISSALELSELHDDLETIHEWHTALLHDALKATHRLDLKRAFPWKNPAEFRWIWVPVLGLILTVFVLPQWDLFTGQGDAQAKMMDKAKVEKDLQNLFKRQITLEKRAKEKELQEVTKIAKEIKDLETKLSKGKIEKREALAKLSSLQEEWEKRQEAMKSAQPKLNESSPMKQKMTGDLAKDLQSNEYEKGAQKLQELQKKLKMGALNKSEMNRLASEMEKLAGSLNANTPLSKALEKAATQLKSGDSKNAIESMQLAEMSMMDLQKLMEQIQMMNQALNDLKMSKSALAGKFGACSQCIKGATGCCSACNGQGCSQCNGTGMCSGNGTGGAPGTGGWKAGPTDKMSSGGMGGAGIGRGGRAPFSDTQTAFQEMKLRGNFNQAPFLGAISVDGESMKNSSSKELQEAFFEYKQAAEDALTKEKIPIPYQYQVRAYFDSLQGTITERVSETENSSE